MTTPLTASPPDLQKINAQRATVGLPPWSQLPSPEGTHPLPPVKNPKRFGWVAASLFALGGLTLGSIGSLGDDTTASVATPTATVTTTASVEKVKTVPQSCLDALDYADEGFGLAAKVIGYMEPAIQAVFELDSAKINQITGKIRKATAKIDKLGPEYNAAKAECRAAS